MARTKRKKCSTHRTRGAGGFANRLMAFWAWCTAVWMIIVGRANEATTLSKIRGGQQVVNEWQQEMAI